MVSNYALPSGQVRKLIVLAGTKRIGTLAAARALILDYRDLEPLSGESVVWGLVEGRFNKPMYTTSREYRGFKMDHPSRRPRP